MRWFCGVPVGVLLLAAGLMPFGPYARAEPASSGAANASPSPQPLQWTACPEIPDTECAGLEVPVDPARPDGQRFTLRLGRLPVLDPTQRKGVLLFIPGGRAPASPRSLVATAARCSTSTSSGVGGMW